AELACSGEPAKAARALEIGLVFDVVPSERLREEGLKRLEELRQSGAWQETRKRKRQPVGLTEEQLGYFYGVARAMVLEKTRGHPPAPPAALEAIAKGCNLPLEDGLAVETEQFIKLVGSPIARNLIAVFFMNGRLQKDPGVADASVQPREVKRAGV